MSKAIAILRRELAEAEHTAKQLRTALSVLESVPGHAADADPRQVPIPGTELAVEPLPYYPEPPPYVPSTPAAAASQDREAARSKAKTKPEPRPAADHGGLESAILDTVGHAGPGGAKYADIAEAHKLDRPTAKNALRRMVRAGQLTLTGKKAGVRYFVAQKAEAAE